ncbi:MULTISPECIES: hypothetical protein [Hyphobacterium]|uniref:Uncharacterized protein n=1 Tax=Hyphobacterium vulgare TaxID=1736751 RepID=A0ABV6ZZF3_9PROT
MSERPSLEVVGPYIPLLAAGAGLGVYSLLVAVRGLDFDGSEALSLALAAYTIYSGIVALRAVSELRDEKNPARRGVLVLHHLSDFRLFAIIVVIYFIVTTAGALYRLAA